MESFVPDADDLRLTIVAHTTDIMIAIRPIRPEEVEAARNAITQVCLEFFGQAPVEFEDMDDIETHYSGAAGLFLVLVDGDNVVGTGAIRQLDERTCELKRMWFLPVYRGRGLGYRMAMALLDGSRQRGYEKVRLDTAPQLEQAVRLYKKLGFAPIERYNDGPCTLFMEMAL